MVIKLNWNDLPADRDGTVSRPGHGAWPRTARTLSIHLPDADLLIQVSGMFGARHEEFAHHRQLFLTEQGHSYRVETVEIV